MSPLLSAGVELMLIGMGTVFVFLTTLVLATSGMSRLALAIAPPKPKSKLTSAGDSPTQEEVAAITAAIAEHRRVNK